METPRNEVSNKCAATSLTFHLGETVCFSQSAGASERRSSISIPSIFGKRGAARVGFNGSVRRFAQLTPPRPLPAPCATTAQTTTNHSSTHPPIHPRPPHHPPQPLA